MGGERDEVFLSKGERDRLAAIERELSSSDPRLTRRLARFHRVDHTLVTANALVVVGNGVAVMTFTSRWWLAATGLAMMATGMFLWTSLAVDRFRRR